jgi:hypothetical protein
LPCIAETKEEQTFIIWYVCRFRCIHACIQVYIRACMCALIASD